MKQTLYLLMVCVLISLNMDAQHQHQNQQQNQAQTHPHGHPDHKCGTEFTPADMQKIRKHVKDYHHIEENFLQNRALLPIEYIPIKAHIARTSSGTGGLTTTQLNDAIDNMNDYYINANMQFYLCNGINYIDNDTYYNYDAADETAMHAAHGVTDLVNIYFCNSVTSGGSGLCGYAYASTKDIVLMDNSCAINGSTLPHEVGHFFSLPHTHGGTNGTLTAELVDGSNCSSTGDFVCDTPADPELGSNNVNASCVYDGTAPNTSGGGLDANGDQFVPNPRNIMSYSRKSCRDFFSPGQYARMYAYATTTRNYFTCPQFNVDFTATPSSTCQNSLTATFTSSATGAVSYIWDVDGNGSTDYTTATCTHLYSTPGSYDVRLSIVDANSDTISKTKVTYINVGSASGLPFSEDFETFSNGLENGWSNADDIDYVWGSNTGTTQSGSSGNTGPAVDKTLGNSSGTYMYTEASGFNGGEEATLITPCVSLDQGSPTLSFAYHMWGVNTGQMGDLHVDINSGGTWTNDITTVLSGNQQTAQGDAYLVRYVDLSAYTGQTVQIRFRAICGSGFASDIAIDDVSITGSGPICPAITVGYSTNNVDCNGNANGQATATPSGGVGPYTYLWDAGAGNQTTATAIGLGAGTYTVVATDTAGCTGDTMLTITEPAILALSISAQTNIDCDSSSGNVTVLATGGTASYTYYLNGGGGTASPMFSGLSGGSHFIAVVDANGCLDTVYPNITMDTASCNCPNVFASITSQTNVDCNGNTNGTATAMGFGGSSPYSYMWGASAGSQTTATAIGLSAGTHFVTVTDDNGCTADTMAMITEPTVLVTTISSQTNIDCDSSTGQVILSISGGVGGYMNSLSGGTSTASTVFNGLSQGFYSIETTDANGCTDSVNFIITMDTASCGCPTTFASITSQTNVDCNGNTNGTATAMGFGGSSPYSYMWGASAGSQTTATAIGLSAGTHFVTVTDDNGCTADTMAMITEPTALVTTISSQTNIDCDSSTGTVVLSITGGVGGYMNSLSGGTSTASTVFNGLSQGFYSIETTDANGCTDSVNFIITMDTASCGCPTTFASITSQTNVDCNGNTNGTATAMGFGGSSPYSYMWGASAGSQTTATAIGLSAGTYFVTVTDDNGCTADTMAMITEPTALVTTISSQTNIDCDSSTGTVVLSITGGVGGYMNSLSGGTGTASTIFNGLSQGFYSIETTDANGCTDSVNFIITLDTVGCNPQSGLYVDMNASGGNNGSNWANAFTDLQSALDLANTGETIYIAEGVYMPSKNTSGVITSGRDATFYVNKDITILGSYGTGGTARNPLGNKTILSGDLGVLSNAADNAYHVLWTTTLSASAHFDGLTIQDGNANGGSFPNDRGAGVYNLGNNSGNSSPTFQNCIFRWNNAGSMGGAMLNLSNNGGTTSPILTGCMFYENSSATGASIANATYLGGVNAMVISNSTFADNTGGASIRNLHGNATITIQNSILWDNTPLSNFATETTLRYSIIKGNTLAAGTTNGGAILQNINPNFTNATADDYSVISFSQAVDAGLSAYLPAGYSVDLNGVTRISGASVDMGAIEKITANNTIIYVDEDAIGGANNGTSWSAAFTSLKSATDIAASGVEIWVADGTYYATTGTDRTVSFEVNDGVKIYGGFSGSESSLSQRDWSANATILSGDIGTMSNSSDNSYHVLSLSALTATTIFDGLIIQDGNANAGTYPNDRGAGVFNNGANGGSSSPSFQNCIFRWNNAALMGGAMVNISNFSGTTSPSITGCLFYENTSASGASIANTTYSSGSNTMVISNSTFADNTGGASIHNRHGLANITIQNSILWDNTPLSNNGTETTVQYSSIRGGSLASGTVNGGNNQLATDPLFVDAANDDYSLQGISPAIAAGNNAYVASGYMLDLANNSRQTGATVDMGCYEDVLSSLDPIAANDDNNNTTDETTIDALNSSTVATMLVYPNPAKDLVNVSVQGLNESTGATVRLLNMQGQVVQQETMNVDAGQTIQLNVDQLTKGVYLLNIQLENGKQLTERVVKF